MATFTAVQCKNQSASSMRGVIDYVEQEEKTCWGDAWLVTGSDCVPQSAFIEMQMTKMVYMLCHTVHNFHQYTVPPLRSRQF